MHPDVLELWPTCKIVSGKLGHFRAAISIASHLLADVEIDVPADLQAAVDCVSRMRHGVSAWRARQLATLRAIAESPDLVQMSAFGPAARAVGRWQTRPSCTYHGFHRCVRVA